METKIDDSLVTAARILWAKVLQLCENGVIFDQQVAFATERKVRLQHFVSEYPEPYMLRLKTTKACMELMVEISEGCVSEEAANELAIKV